MQALPPVVAGDCTFLFPLGAVSAGRLAKRMLDSPPDTAGDGWFDMLAADPPLASWAWLHARQVRPVPSDLQQLARWLDGQVRELFVAAAAPLPCPAAEPDAEAEAVFEDVFRSELAHALAARFDPAAGPYARLLGLVARADRWLVQGAPASAAELLAEARECQWVSQARAVIAGESPWPTDVPEEPLRVVASAAQARWLQPGLSVAELLPVLARQRNADARQLDERLERAKVEALAEFAAGAGHEINNPLTVITGRAQLLLRDETDPERRHTLALMSAQAMRVHEMIADMRLFARPPRLERKRCDLASLARKAVEELTPAATERSTTLVYGGTAEPLEIEADPVQLAVVLRALVRNALEALGQAGHVVVRARWADSASNEAVLIVADDGPGIDPAHRPHIFDPFYSARQAGRGLGLGLSKCWQIARQHGGRIEVESQPGRGTVVTVTLPQ